MAIVGCFLEAARVEADNRWLDEEIQRDRSDVCIYLMPIL